MNATEPAKARKGEGWAPITPKAGTPRAPGDANARGSVYRFPRSAFLGVNPHRGYCPHWLLEGSGREGGKEWERETAIGCLQQF